MVTCRLVKGHLLHLKRASFTCQKGIFYNAKGALLEGERWSLKKEEDFSLQKVGNVFFRTYMFYRYIRIALRNVYIYVLWLDRLSYLGLNRYLL